MGRAISFAEWRDAVDVWLQYNGMARSLTCCVVCSVQMPNSHPECGACLFDICDMCVEQERRTALADDAAQMTFDFTF